MMSITKVPQGVALCMQDECPMAATCLRNVALQNLSEEIEHILIVNPLKTQNRNKECKHYREYKIIKYAYGFNEIYKKIPVGNAKHFWANIPGISSERMYYRMKSGEYPISPSSQEAIIDAARKAGAIGTLSFDKYCDEIDWKV